ncbi:hypothetical protein D3C81_1295590 [compost metagenome]
MKEGPRVRATWKAMDIAAAGHHFAQLLRIGALVIEQLLGLRAVGIQGQRFFTNTQCTVGGDPPVLGCTAFGLARRQQFSLIGGCAIALFVGLRHGVAGNRRATRLQGL